MKGTVTKSFRVVVFDKQAMPVWAGRKYPSPEVGPLVRGAVGSHQKCELEDCSVIEGSCYSGTLHNTKIVRGCI